MYRLTLALTILFCTACSYEGELTLKNERNTQNKSAKWVPQTNNQKKDITQETSNQDPNQPIYEDEVETLPPSENES